MANEITVISSISVAKGYFSIERGGGVQQITMSGDETSSGIQTIGFAAHEILEVHTDFGTAGWGFFQNLDLTNYVEVGRDQGGTFVPVLKLKPGVSVAVPLASKLIYAKANTGAVKLLYELYEE
jgi:hypothetical protein